MNLSNIKEKIILAIEEKRDRLFALSQSIFDEPELKFEEHRTAAKLVGELENIKGICIQRGVADLETAFIASLEGSKDRPIIAMLAEYDALPQIGHGCGHNLICTSTVGAMWGIAAVIDQFPGKIQVIGTPGEEGGGGKIIMQERGSFDGVDALYAIHPSTYYAVGLKTQGMKQVRFRFSGKATHAAYSPDLGRSALEAVIQTFVNINGMRQFTKEDARIHGIIDEGGKLPNIVPDFASCLFYTRSVDEEYLDELTQRVELCAKAAAMSTGTGLEVSSIEGKIYRPMRPNQVIAQVMRKILEEMGITDIENIPYLPASNDIGTLSHFIPAARAMLKVCDAKVPMHSQEFARVAMSENGREMMILAAKLQALTAVELLANPDIMKQVKREFAK